MGDIDQASAGFWQSIYTCIQLTRASPWSSPRMQAHGRLAIWRQDPAPLGAPLVGSQHELPVVSPAGMLQQPRTPAASGLMPAFAGSVRTPMSASSFAGTSYAPSTIKRWAVAGACVLAVDDGADAASISASSLLPPAPALFLLAAWPQCSYLPPVNS